MSDSELKDTWKIVVITEQEKKKRVEVNEDCTVLELINAVAKNQDQQPEHIILIYANTQTYLSIDQPDVANAKLSNFGITDNSVVTLVLRLIGGSVEEDFKQKMKTLKPLKGFITVTNDPDDVDMLSLDNSLENERAKMPCGHVIGPESMTEYCHSLMKEGKYIFRCPYSDPCTGNCCNRVWPFFLVRHVACLTPEEVQHVEQKIAENVLKRAIGIQQCPGCNNWCFRADPTNNCVLCSVCTKKLTGGRVYQFCWQCLGEWRGRKSCENDECKELDRRLQIISTCPDKLIEEKIMAPSVRGCPRCGVLIEHKDHCKHMTCRFCCCSFCFLCLAEKKEGKWQCEAYTRDCHVAPRQTWLPSIKDVQFKELYTMEEDKGSIEHI